MSHTVTNLVRNLLDSWAAKLGIGVFGALFGPVTAAHEALFVVVLADLVTGVLAAAKERRLSSRVMAQKTIAKFVAYSAVLLLAYQVERSLVGTPYAYGTGFTLSAALIYLVCTEALSTLENIYRLTGKRMRLFYNPHKLIDIIKSSDQHADRDRS